MTIPTEDELEQWVLEVLGELGWTHVYGPDIDPESETPERDDWRVAILAGRVRAAVERRGIVKSCGWVD